MANFEDFTAREIGAIMIAMGTVVMKHADLFENISDEQFKKQFAPEVIEIMQSHGISDDRANELLKSWA